MVFVLSGNCLRYTRIIFFSVEFIVFYNTNGTKVKKKKRKNSIMQLKRILVEHNSNAHLLYFKLEKT